MTGADDAALPDPARVVCVGGLHRSGTTPLARALAAHPQVSGLVGTGVKEDEGQHLQDVYPRAKVHGGSGRFARAAAAHLTEASPLATADAGARLLRAWVPYWDTSRPVLVEKSPPDMLMGRFLQAVLPGSALVVVVRHPVVVALSTKKWRSVVSRDPRRHEGLASLVEHWVVAHRRLLEDLPSLRAAGARVHLLHYEDLVRAPAAELGRLGATLGLDGPVPADGLTAARSERYEQQWARAAAWWRPSSAWRRAVERRHPGDVAALGYDLVDLRARGPWSEAARALAGPATPPDPVG
ncbi:sulfotransferase [Pseudokineococcus lusitanus]|uniref:Sulfotransferase family protein n=1 Tax=Pseudokineococcus lusitanus TaxID=763993 RepID=A0A3N1HNE2_9ACTN|nr:sulfotransferase [Pseudokineococcus lusitanus]ROP44033.1 sulfotransferase family protein [Pseudokineococcus lusitanus]